MTILHFPVFKLPKLKSFMNAAILLLRFHKKLLINNINYYIKSTGLRIWKIIKKALVDYFADINNLLFDLGYVLNTWQYCEYNKRR